MKSNRIIYRLAALTAISFASTAVLSFGQGNADQTKRPIAGVDLAFDEVDGLAAVEAEHFYKQSANDVRAWYITSSKSVPGVTPDGDPPHVAGASGGAYVEILPDTRRTHGDKLVGGENFSNEAGKMGVLHYKVHINNPGRYYVWVRAHSTGSEDNGLHVGLNGEWPATGQRLQWCEGKQTWRWDSKQRTQEVHCGEPYKIYLDIEKPGVHEIQFSMREDGFEFDKFILTKEREFARPADAGPKPEVKRGQLPPAFPEVAKAPAEKSFPAHWGEPPQIQTMDYVPLPGGYGHGSSTMARWIQANLDKDAAAAERAFVMEAASFPTEGTGYYLDSGKWLAINPSNHEKAKAASAFPFPSGKYHVTLHAVGESDGKSTYEVIINGTSIGKHTCPLSTETYEEAAKFNATWKNIEVNSGDVIEVASAIASEDGQEHSRARWARLSFQPADVATKAAAASVVVGAKPVREVVAKPVVPLVLPRGEDGDGTVAVGGELRQWHKVVLTLDGPYAHELDNEPNPFTDLNMVVTFTHESGSPSYQVPGYFAADGDTANSSAQSGTVWRANLSPDKPGTWTYTVSFTQGKLAALNADASRSPVAPYHGQTGTFRVKRTNAKGRDFRKLGRLEYVGKHYLQHAGSKEFFLKAGADAPETLLAYVDFDNTIARKANVPLKTWEPHVQDWQEGDPTWGDGKGKGLIGALNYLASKGVNAFSFLPYNAGGDGDNIWPFVVREDKMHYDVSKLSQWDIVFDHATAKGLYLHFKMQENEMDDDRRGHESTPGRVPESLDGGKLGPERKLYVRELIARFAHNLALNWNIGEENTQSTEDIRDMARYIHDTDPYHHNIVIHTFPNQQDKVYTPLLGDQSLLTGASLQNSWNVVHQQTLKWVNESAEAGRPWVVANDEQGSASLGAPPDPGYKGWDGKDNKGNEVHTLHDIRKRTLWGNLMAGGAGVEYYFGYQLPENDLVAEDWRSRDQSWDYCRIALEFFRENKIPFWEMKTINGLIGNPDNENSKFCFAKPGDLYLVYLPEGGSTGPRPERSEGLVLCEVV